MVATKRLTPSIRQVVLDTEDARGLAEFYRQLLGLRYRAGDESPTDGTPDVNGADWVTLLEGDGDGERKSESERESQDESEREGGSGWRFAFQQVAHLPEPTWPEGPRPQMMHLDFSVDTVAELAEQHARALGLGARVLQDRSDDAEEPLYVYADPSGHPFCIFVKTSE